MRLLTWDNIELVSISRATGVTFGVILALLLLLCFCGGIALGWRKVSQNPNSDPDPHPNPNPNPHPNPNP